MRTTLTVVVALACALLLTPRQAGAVARSCGSDPVANTANVLCASPSGPCNATSVTMSSNIEVTGSGCLFDIGGRTLSLQKTFQMNGQGFIKIMNAGNVTITDTGKLKARGDFVLQNGFIVQGGLITIDSSGTITLINGAIIDVSGDGAGEIDLTSQGDLTVQNGSTLEGTGITSFTDTGDRFADGGLVSLTSLGGNVLANGAIIVSGDNQAQGGEVDMQAARDVQINQQIDATGGGGDGGDVEIDAGDSITITKTVDVSSRVGGGFGGSMSLSSGEDGLGGVTLGGGITININNATLKLNGSDAETSGGDGGDFEADASGTLQIIGSGTAIQANGGSTFDGSGGTIFFDSGDDNPNVIGPQDGNLSISGAIVMQSGGAGGDGGDFDFSAGRDFTLTGSIDVTGQDDGGDVTGDAGGAITLAGTITTNGAATTGVGGFVDFTAGEASNAMLTVARNIIATGGTTSGQGQSISLAGCSLTVSDNIKIDGHAGVSSTNVPGGSQIELISRQPMQLRPGSQYLANPGGSIVTTHPSGANPQIGAGAVFNPPRMDNIVAEGPYPNCPVCGDGIRQAGEVCDKGAGADGSCCNATCSAFTCPTATATLTVTPSRTPTPTRTPTPILTSGTAGPSGTATLTPLITPTPTRTASPTVTATATGTPTPVPTVTAGPGIDHYKCYKARTAAGAAGFVQQQLALDDVFESKVTNVIKTDSFCDPVDVNGQGINDPSAQLQCYKIRDAAGQQSFASRNLTADDEFGVRPLTAKKAKLLCVPSTRDGQPSALHIDHFKCYTAKIPSGSPKFTEQQRTLTDAFESKITRVTGPETVCNAVAVNGGTLLSPAAQLHCYRVKDASGQPRFARTNVAAANDLASEQLSVQKSHLVCVPSTRPAAPSCGDGFLDPGEQCDDGNTNDGDGCDSNCTLESCGNGVVDGGEQCDHGAANGTDDCCSSTCQLVDPDGDGVCNRDDVCPADADNDSDGDGFCIGLAFHAPKVGGGDPCSRPAGTGTWVKPKVVFTKLAAPSGDEKLSIKGAFIIPTGGPALALDLYGVHIRILDAQKSLVLDEHIPGGAYLSSGQPIGWKVAGTPPVKWNYLDKANKPPLHNGISKVTVANKSNSVPGLVTVTLKAVTATYTLSPGQEPLTVTLELNDQALPAGSLPGTDQCGEVVFGVPPAVPACVFSGGPTNDAKLSCK